MKKWPTLFLISFYCLLFGEVFIRIFAPVALMPRYVTGAEYGVRMNIPNSQYWQTTPETQVQLRINTQGIRADHNYDYTKPPGHCRILLFGDSFFMGYEVDLTDSFSQLLEQNLLKAGYACQVINLAVSGFGTAEMLITLANEGLKYQPDIVVFQWHITDPYDNVRSKLFGLDAQGQLIPLNLTYLPGIPISDWLTQFTLYRWLIENSQLYSAIRENTARKIKSILVSFRKNTSHSLPTNDETDQSEETGNNAISPYAMQLSFRLLQAAQQLAQQHHAHFYVLEIPRRHSRTEFSSQVPDFPAELVQKLSLLTPLSVLQAAAHPEVKLYYEKGHFHLTPLGNRLVADYFFQQLHNSGILKSFKILQ